MLRTLPTLKRPLLKVLSQEDIKPNKLKRRKQITTTMAVSKNLFNMVRKKFHKSSHIHTDNTNLSNTSSSEEAIVREETDNAERDIIVALPTPKKGLTKEDVKAIKIQAFFRGYLARRRAPKTVVTRFGNKRMGMSKNYFKIVQRKFLKSSHTNTSPSESVEELNVREESTYSEEPNSAAALIPTSQRKDLTKEDVAAIKIQAFFRGHRVRQTFQARESIVINSKKKRIGKPQKCFKIVQRRFHKRSHRDAISPNANTSPSNSIEEAIVKKESTNFEDLSDATIVKKESTSTPLSKESTNFEDPNGEGETIVKMESINFEDPNGIASSASSFQVSTNCEDPNGAASSAPSSQMKDLTKKDVAAIKIQAIFRGHHVRQTLQTFQARDNIAASPKKERMRKPQNCFNIVQRRFHKRSHRDTISSNANTSPSNFTEEAIVKTTNVEDPSGGAASSTPSSQRKDLTKEDVAASKIQAIFRGHHARRSFLSLKSLVPSSRKRENQRRTTQMSQNWFNIVRKKFRKTPHRDIILSHTNTCARSSTDETFVPEETINFENTSGAASSTQSSRKKDLTEKEVAAIKIQAFFRAHLARRAFRALRSLVKLQAVVRGVCVRRQVRVAMHCMHALARLQVRVRTRQLLNGEEVL